MRFPDTGRFKGMAFITFADQAAYETALTCNGSELDGQTLRVRSFVMFTSLNKFAICRPTRQPRAPSKRCKNNLASVLRLLAAPRGCAQTAVVVD